MESIDATCIDFIKSENEEYTSLKNDIVQFTIKQFILNPDYPEIIIKTYDELIKSKTEESLSDSFRLLSSIPDNQKHLFYNYFGKAYHNGYGTPPDLIKSADYFRKSEYKPVWAQLELYDVLKAIGTDESYGEMISIAQENIRSRKSNGWMMGRLGLAYADGTGVPQDNNQARYWLQRAADKEVSWARNRLEKMQ